MTITASTPTETAGSADPTRNHVRAAGIFYLVTFAASIPALILIQPVLNDPGFITGSGPDTRVLWGCFLDFINALAGIGSAVALFPVLKRRMESLALGFVTSRMLEAAVIMIGVVSLLAVVTLRQDVAGTPGTDPATLTTIGQALVAVRDWTFLFGPGFMPAFSALLLGSLLYRFRLVPRFIPAMGLVGAPLLLIVNILTVLGHNSQISVVSAVGTVLVAAWELTIGIYMIVKGFNTTAVAKNEAV